MNFFDYALESILHAFVVPNDWRNHTKKKMDLKQEKKEFKANGDIVFDWIIDKYEGDNDKLYSSYNTTIFSKYQDREVLQVLAIILR